MLVQGLDGNLTEFDLKHFCERSPALCYHFRLTTPERQEAPRPELSASTAQQSIIGPSNDPLSELSLETVNDLYEDETHLLPKALLDLETGEPQNSTLNPREPHKP